MLTDLQIAQVPKNSAPSLARIPCLPFPENAVFKDESQFYRWYDKAERAKLVAKSSGKNAPPAVKGTRSDPTSKRTSPGGSPSASIAASQRNSMQLSEPVVGGDLSSSPSLEGTILASAGAPVQLGTDVTREEWVRWLMVTPSPEDRSSFICSYIGWCVVRDRSS